MKRAAMFTLLIGSIGSLGSVGCTSSDGDESAAEAIVETSVELPLIEHSLVAVEVPVAPVVPPAAPPPAPREPVVAPPAEHVAAPSGCVAVAEVLCDGVDQDCDRTDACDANGDGVVEQYTATGDPGRRVGVTTE